MDTTSELVALAQRAADNLQATIDADMDRHRVLCRFITDMKDDVGERLVGTDGVELAASDAPTDVPTEQVRPFRGYRTGFCGGQVGP